MTEENAFITCEPHFCHEDASNHAESVLYMQRLGNLEDYTFDKASQGSPWLQALERYILFIHPATTIEQNVR